MRTLILASIVLAGPALAQGVVADTSEGAVVRAEAQSLRAACGGGDALIEGNHNTIVLTGQCRSLLLKGVANTVAIELRPGAAIRVEGSANRVSYQAAGPAPTVETFGPDNLASAGPIPPAPVAPPAVTPAAPVPPPAVQPAAPQAASVPNAPPPKLADPRTGVLTLAGPDRSLEQDCTGRDVAIEGVRSSYVLRGGCRSVAVRGDLMTVQAEVQPGAHITVSGRSSTVFWALRERGAPPLVQVRGEASRAQRTATIGGQPPH